MLGDMLAHVLGKQQEGGVHATMQSTALCKERGVNNGALTDAMPARIVTISEMDESLKINEDALKVLVSGESQHVKQMYGRECEKKPVMKITFLVNALPKFKNPDANSTRRRHVYVPMPVLFLDESKAPDRAMRGNARQVRIRGKAAMHDCQKERELFSRARRAIQTSVPYIFCQRRHEVLREISHPDSKDP